MGRKQESVLQRLAAQAVRLGADTLEVEYKDSHEEVVALRGAIGQGIARLKSSSSEAASLLQELHGIAGRRWSITLDDHEFEVRCRVYESFGEDAFRLTLKRAIGGCIGMAKKKRRKESPRRTPPVEGLAVPWLDDDGLHMLLPGDAPSEALLDRLTEQYQENIRKSPLWDEIVRRFGREEAERILKGFRVQVR